MFASFKYKALVRKTHGSALAEYGILAALICIAGISAIAVYSGQVSFAFKNATEEIAAAQAGATKTGSKPTKPRVPWTFPPAPSSAGCQIMTAGNDAVVILADTEQTCFHLLSGVDSVDEQGGSKPTIIYSDAAASGTDQPDTIALNGGDDYVDGAGAASVDTGSGNDYVRLDLGVLPEDVSFDMGPGDDILHLTATGYTDASPYKRGTIHLQAGKDEALLTCDHATKPPFTLRTWENASVKSSCRTEVFFDEPGFNTDLDLTMDALTWASATSFLAPGTINANYKLYEGSYVFEFHKDIKGSINITEKAPDGAKGSVDLKFWKHGGPQLDLSLKIDGTFANGNLILPPELNDAIDLSFEITSWSNIQFHLGERSAIGEFPEVAVTGSELRLDFEPWSGASDDDLRLALLDAGGAVVFDYDMALASGVSPTLTTISPRDHNIEDIRVTRQGRDWIIPINGTGDALSVHTIGIRHE